MTVSRTWPTGSDDGRPEREVSKALSEKEKKIIERIAQTIPKMTEAEKMYLLGQAEGMAIMRERESENEVEKAG